MQIALIFVAAWLTISTVLSFMAGWYRLAAKFPDRVDTPLLRVRVQSGSMGGVSMHNVITLGACPSGLRVSMLRIFGPFCRNFFIPWEQVSVARDTMWWMDVAKLRFGHPHVGTLTIPSHLADRLWRAVGAQWPERGSAPEPSVSGLRRRLMVQWAVGTTIAALFLTIASITLGRSRPPIALTILFPAIVLSISGLVQYWRDRRTLR